MSAIVEILVGSIVLTTLWIAAAYAAIRLLRIPPGSGVHFVISAVPLLAAIFSRDRLAGDSAQLVIAFFTVYALVRMALRMRGYGRLMRTFLAASRPSRALQARTDQLAKRMGVAAPRVLLSHEDHGPLCCGWRRPIIVLPRRLFRRLSRVEQNAVLAHELGHIAHGDTYWKCLLAFFKDVAALNPMAALPFHWINENQEHAADRRALRATGDVAAMVGMLAKVQQFAHGVTPDHAPQVLIAHAASSIDARVARLSTIAVAHPSSYTRETLKLIVAFGFFLWFCLKPLAFWQTLLHIVPWL